jgi:hypothetical protein
MLGTLLAPPTPENLDSWQFDHANAHRQLLGAMSEPFFTFQDLLVRGGLSMFSALPYWVDPQLNVGMWHLDHGQAHADAQTTLVAWFGFTPVELKTGMAPNPDFVDFDLKDPSHLQWWTHQNHVSHLTAQSTLPLELVFPFW